MGEVIADGMYEAAHPSDFGGAVAAFMNSAACVASLLYNQITGGEQPGEVTYAEIFTVQPFGNTLVVKTCTGASRSTRCSSSSIEPTRATGQQRLMAVSDSVTLLVHPRRARSARSVDPTGR